MDFGWSSEQADLHRRALAFARERLVPATTARGGAPFPHEAWRQLGEFGLFTLPLTTARGGLGLGSLTVARVMEALGQGCPDMGLVFAASAHLFACVIPAAHGASARLAAEVLPGLVSGQHVGANAITEAEAGSDVFAMRTTARREGDDYILDGSKSFVTNAPYGEELLVYAVTDRDGGFLGVSAFMVNRSTPGLSVGPAWDKMGLETAGTAPIYLDGVRVPSWRRVGAEGGGARLFQHSMAWERCCLLAAFSGAMEAELEECLAYARQRQQFGRPIAKNQAVSHRIVGMKQRLDAARLLLYRACWAHDTGADATVEISLAKLAISEAAVQSSLDAIGIHGGAGYIRGVGVERRLRDAVPTTIFSGTSDIQRELIAARLGL